MNNTFARRRILSARRIALMATTVAGLGALALAGQPLLTPADSLPGLSAPAHAQSVNAARPVGFADIVEKVKPAVVQGQAIKQAEDTDLASLPCRPELYSKLL